MTRVPLAMCVLLTVLMLSAPLALASGTDDPLVRGFHSPPPDARPLVFWQWMNGCVTKEGIVSDLDSFQRVGLAGVLHRTQGIMYLLEPYATAPDEPFDLTTVSAAGDALMCEFWQKPSTWGWDSVRPFASAAHTWGKGIVAAEAFTGQPQFAWRRSN